MKGWINGSKEQGPGDRDLRWGSKGAVSLYLPVAEREPENAGLQIFGKENVVRFKIRDYLANETIIIDPLNFRLICEQFLDNWGYTATPGPDGSFCRRYSFGTGYPIIWCI